MATKKEHKPRTGRPRRELPKLKTTPETLAKELLKQRPLKEVEQEHKGGGWLVLYIIPLQKAKPHTLAFDDKIVDLTTV